MTEDLVAFLRARLDEDEQIIRRNLGESGVTDGGFFPDYRTYTDDDTAAAVDFLGQFKPPRMLAEVDAKRALIAETIEPYLGFDTTMARVANQALRLLAPPYADHPSYRPEWRP